MLRCSTNTVAPKEQAGTTDHGDLGVDISITMSAVVLAFYAALCLRLLSSIACSIISASSYMQGNVMFSYKVDFLPTAKAGGFLGLTARVFLFH